MGCGVVGLGDCGRGGGIVGFGGGLCVYGAKKGLCVGVLAWVLVFYMVGGNLPREIV